MLSLSLSVCVQVQHLFVFVSKQILTRANIPRNVFEHQNLLEVFSSWWACLGHSGGYVVAFLATFHPIECHHRLFRLNYNSVVVYLF